MEAVFFRFLGREMLRALTGARIEKIYLPSPNVITVALYVPSGQDVPGHAGKRTLYLHARYGTGRFFLFLSAQKTVQPQRAPAAAMRLRKHLGGRRVATVVSDWPRRRLTLILAGDGPALVLDPQAFPDLTAAPEAPPDEVVWPPLEAVLADPDIWRAHPQLSPTLRRRLAGLPPGQARATYDRLIEGSPDGFHLETKNGEPHGVWPLAWPQASGVSTRRFETALEAAAAFGEPLVFGEVSGRGAAPETAARAAGRRRLARSLARLAEDEQRMRAFIARRAEADILAANLHALDKQARLSGLSLPTGDGGIVALSLDPSLTVLQNMQKLYRLAAKGERGLTAIAARRRDLRAPEKDLQDRGSGAGRGGPANTSPGAVAGIAAHAYRTSDGFLVLRGKNAKANDRLLRSANPFDLWFHAAGGPGAHVILRRDHPRREVPRRSIEEAAGLAGLASFAAGAGTAEIMVARVADVRREKGAPAGLVRVEALLETVRARLDPALEDLREP